TTFKLFCVEKTKFIKGIVNTRNYYTHYSAKGKTKILVREELHWAIIKISLMIRALLLLSSGLTEEEVQILFGDHHGTRRDRAVWGTIAEEGSAFNDLDEVN